LLKILKIKLGIIQTVGSFPTILRVYYIIFTTFSILSTTWFYYSTLILISPNNPSVVFFKFYLVSEMNLSVNYF